MPLEACVDTYGLNRQESMPYNTNDYAEGEK